VPRKQRKVLDKWDLTLKFWQQITRRFPVGKWVGILKNNFSYELDGKQFIFEVVPELSLRRKDIINDFLKERRVKPLLLTVQLDELLFNECQRLEVNCADIHDHMFLRAEGIWADLSRSAVDSAFQLSSRAIRLVGNRRKIALLLLSNPLRAWNTAQVQRDTRLSANLVWKTMGSLECQGWLAIIRTGEWRLKDPEALRKACSEKSQQPEQPLMEPHHDAGGSQGDQFLKDFFWNEICASFPADSWIREGDTPVFHLDGVAVHYQLKPISSLEIKDVLPEKDQPRVLFMTTYLQNSVFKECQRAGMSCADLSGRVLLRSKGIWFQRPKLWKIKVRSSWMDRRIFSGKSMRVPLVLLGAPGVLWSISNLIHATGLSWGIVWRILDYCRKQGWVKSAGGWQLTHREDLLEALRNVQSAPADSEGKRRPRKAFQMCCYQRAGDLTEFANQLMDHIQPIRFAYETVSSIKAGQGIGTRLVCYSPRFFTKEEKQNWQLVGRYKGGGNICVLRPDDDFLLTFGENIGGYPVGLLSFTLDVLKQEK
jgi:hypothetical protein